MLLSTRSNDKEFLDVAEIKTSDLNRNLIELDIINNYLGGYKGSLNGLKDLLSKKININTVLDIGFGGGDSIKQLAHYTNKLNKNIFFYGVDLKKDCVDYAEINLTLINNKQLICDDYRNISTELLDKVNLIHCSLFLHHLKEEEIVALFKFCKAHHCVILANDLHRHWLAYYSIKVLTLLFSKSYLVKNDAPLSVKRGFKKKELISLLERAGFTNYKVKWSWAFRFIVIAEK